MARALNGLVLPIVSTAILIIPMVISWELLGTRFFFNFLAADAMYYAEVANNFVKFGFPTSDGLTTTNGFQPLWGWFLILVFKCFHVGHDQQLLMLFALSALCVVAGYAILSFTFYRLLGLLPGLIATLILFPGLYPLLFEPTSRYAGEGGLLYAINPWSAINGVESPLVILTWSLLFLLLSRNGGPRVAAASTRVPRVTDYFPLTARWCLAAILLCRLEQGLALIAIAAASFALPAESQLQRLRDIVAVLLPSAIVAAVYVAYNLAAVGVPLPTSGLSKIHVGLTANLQYLSQVMLGGRMGGAWWLVAARLYPILFGACAGLTMLAAAYRGRRNLHLLDDSQRMPLHLTAFGLFLFMNSAFLFVFEPVWDIGYWYFWPITLIPATLAALQLGSWTGTRRPLVAPVLTACCAIILFRIPNELHFMNSTNVAQLSRFSDYQDVVSRLWTSRNPIREGILRRYPGAKLVDTSDGVFGFMLDLPARSLTGLVSSPAELRRRQEVGFWQSALEDGFDIVPNSGYFSLQDESSRDIEVVDEFRPPSSPVAFFRVRLRPTASNHG